MKNCPMCNFENADTVAFCTQCGARLDERKECPSCKALLSPDAVFCNNCGARVDGKTVCESCGTVYEGSFCHAGGNGEGVSRVAGIHFSRADRLCDTFDFALRQSLDGLYHQAQRLRSRLLNLRTKSVPQRSAKSAVNLQPYKPPLRQSTTEEKSVVLCFF